jgi:hypothetical protein
LPGFDDLVHSLDDMDSVNLFTCFFLSILKILNEEHPLLRRLPLGLAAFCGTGAGVVQIAAADA